MPKNSFRPRLQWKTIVDFGWRTPDQAPQFDQFEQRQPASFRDWLGGLVFNFAAGGFSRFRLTDIEKSAGLNPGNTTAFITGLTFAGSGSFTGTQTPIVVNVQGVPKRGRWLGLALHNALRAEERKGILLALRRRDQPVPLLASVIPVMAPPDGAVGPGTRFALVILQNPDEAAIGLAHLQWVYGFTAAECKLAEALLANDTLESYGERTAVSRSTLRSHLAHLFKKTGTCRQSELVRLLMLAQPRV